MSSDQISIDQMSTEQVDNNRQIIEQAKADFLRSKEMLIRAIETTPDDKLNWSPSATARTPLQQVAHAASALKGIHDMLDGRTFQTKTTAEADKSFREFDQQFTTREPVMEILEQNSAAYVRWLDELTPQALAGNMTLPFGMGEAPLTVALSFPSDHTNWHVAQINYIQTVYGDHEWH